MFQMLFPSFLIIHSKYIHEYDEKQVHQCDENYTYFRAFKQDIQQITNIGDNPSQPTRQTYIICRLCFYQLHNLRHISDKLQNRINKEQQQSHSSFHASFLIYLALSASEPPFTPRSQLIFRHISRKSLSFQNFCLRSKSLHIFSGVTYRAHT